MSRFLHDDLSFRARFLFSIDGTLLDEPIENVTIRFQNGVAVVDENGTPDIDLGNVAIIPELVNAHTHLEFSSLERPLRRRSQETMADWIIALLRWRDARDADVTAHDRAVEKGLTESANAGTGLLGEIATQSEWPPAYGLTASAARSGDLSINNDLASSATSASSVSNRIEGVRFLELIGLGSERIDAQLAEAERFLNLPSPHGWRPGISPHAPYTAGWRLIQAIPRLSQRYQAPVAFHLAETPDEIECLSSHRGPLVDLLMDRGIWEPKAIPRGIRPFDYLRELSAAHRVLVIHGNYLTPPDWACLSMHAATMSVVYCPRTFAYFGHARYPLRQMLDRGVHVAVGTDSSASNPDLNLFEDLRFMRQQHPDVTAREVLGLGTVNGAQALGAPSVRLQTVALADVDAGNPFETLFKV